MEQAYNDSEKTDESDLDEDPVPCILRRLPEKKSTGISFVNQPCTSSEAPTAEQNTALIKW